MKQEVEKVKLIEEFDNWVITEKFNTKPTEREALGFFAFVLNEKPHLLDFCCRGDKWQQVKSWLYEYSRIQ